MPDGQSRIARELFLTAFGARLSAGPPWVTDRMTSILEEEEAQAGTKLFAVGDPPVFCYFVREGKLRVVADGAAAILLEGPCVVGMFDALLDRPRTHTVTAQTDLSLMRVRTEAWMELLEDSFTIARTTILALGRSIALLEQRVLVAGTGPGARACLAFEPPPGRLSVIERMALLIDVPLLRGLGVQTLSDLSQVSREVAIEPGQPLFRRGEARERIFVVIEGEVEASRAEPDVVWRGGPGCVVCGAASFGEVAMSWEAHATTAARVLAFRIDDWFDLMEEHFEMVRATLAALSLQREKILGPGGFEGPPAPPAIKAPPAGPAP